MPETQTLDDVDTLFPVDQKQDVDALFPSDIERNRQAGVVHSPVQDLIFGDTDNPRSVAHVLDAFGQGFKQSWGADKLGISDGTADYLKKIGIFNDYQKGQTSLIKAGNEVLIRPAAITFDALARGVFGAIHGVAHVFGEPGEQAEQVLQDPALAASLEGMGPPGALAGGTLALLQRARSLRVIGEGEAGWKGTAPTEPATQSADAVKSIVEDHRELPGQPEAPTPTVAPTATPAPTPAPAVAEATKPEPVAPDIHAVARHIAPTVFNEYDALAQRKDTFRRWLDELRETRDQDAKDNAPHADEIADLQGKIDAGATPRLTKKYQARLEPLIEERDAFIADKTSGDSADMANIRQKLMETDYRMRDLAPDVAKAYRDAEAQMPKAEPAIDATHDVVSGANSAKAEGGPVYIDRRIPEFSPTLKDKNGQPANLWKYLALHENEEAQAEREGLSYAKAHSDVATPAERAAVEADGVNWDEYTKEIDGYLAHIEKEKPVNPPAEPLHVDAEAAIGHHKSENKVAEPKAEPELPFTPSPSIAHDVAQKLITAGRPSEEANAAGQLVAAYWQTRAERFEGRKGTAEAMYASEGPEIKAGKEKTRAPAYAQKGKTFEQSSAPSSPEFKSWFGDSAVTDQDGNPLIVYHGTNRRFSEFKPTEGLRQDETGHKFATKSPAFFFSPDKEVARRYAFNQSMIDKNLRSKSGGRQTVQPFYLSIKSPLDFVISDAEMKYIDAEGEYFVRQDEPSPYAAQRIEFITGYAPQTWREVQEALDDPHVIRSLQSEGIDGIHLSEEDGSEAWAAFDPTQIKSAAKNTGEYSAENPNFYHQDAKGRIRLRDDGRSTITLLKTADASTFIHETGHEWLDRMLRDAKDADAPESLKTDARTVRDWLGMKVGEPPPPKPGMIRYYHGTSANSAEGFSGKTFVAPQYEYARNYRGGPNNVLYADFTKDEAVARGIYDDINNYPRSGSIEDGADRLKPFDVAVNVTTRQHEKFARGFETYMMEGRAPSRGLAGVFSKFKDWLTRIYNVVTALKAPITDDIRDVFDRLLTSKPERVAVAPETQTEQGLAEAHESLAEATEPAQSLGVSGKIRAERDSKAAEKLVESENAARLADARTGTPEHPAGGAKPPGAADAARAVGGEAEAPVGPGTVGQGGSETAAESSPARQESTKPAPEPVAPNDAIPVLPTKLIDKAGNIRLDNLGTPEDVNAVIRQTAAELAPYDLAITRGVVSDAQVLDLADALGMDAAKLNTRRLGEAFNAEQIMAARKLLVQSATELRDLAAKVEGGTDADVLAYAQAEARHRMIQEQVSGVTAEAGRALRAFRSIAGMTEARAIGAAISDTTGRTLYQIRSAARKVAQLDTPGKVSGFVRQAAEPGVFDWLQSIFVNWLISGPFTHAGYTAAGQLLGLYRALGVTGASALAGTIRRGLGLGGEESARFGEAVQQLYGMARGARNGVKASWKAWQSGQTELPAEVVAQDELERNAGQTASNMFGSIPNPQIAGRPVPIGTIIQAPSRLVAALHSFNWTTYYSQSIAAQAYRTAMGELREGKLASDEIFANRLGELTEHPTEAMIKQASHEANEGALITKPNYDSFMGKVSQLTNYGMKMPDIPLPGGGRIPMGTFRPGKYIDPFVQIAGNVMKVAAGDSTPLEFFRKEVRDDLSGKNGSLAFDLRAGRLLAGVGLAAAAMGLAAEGLLNGSGPSDPQQAREWQRINGQPHGLRIGEMSYDLLRLGPLGMRMSIAADLYQIGAEAASEDVVKAAEDLVYAFSQNILDESFMRGPAELLQAVEDHDRYGPAWVRNFIASWTPFSVGSSQIARLIDPYAREARTTLDAIKAKLPFISESLEPRRDVWGEPVPNRGWAGTYYQPVKVDPVDQAMWNLGIYPSLPERRIRGVQLSDAQYDDYSRIAGRTAKMRLNAIVAMPGFNQMPAEVRHDLLVSTVKDARETAADIVMMQNPSIITAANDAKRAKARGETVH